MLELAGDTPVSDVSATEVARAAGVHRSTLYQHAAGPAELLDDALLEGLDALRAGLLADPARDTAVAVAEVTRGVLELVRAHAAVFRRGLADDAGTASLHGLLSRHFLGTSRLLLDQGRLVVPVRAPGVPDDVTTEAALRSVAQGTVGVIATWLRGPDPLEVADFVALHAALLPAWWVRPGRGGAGGQSVASSGSAASSPEMPRRPIS